jgi:uncharacterized protein (DUF58 family)
VIRPSSGVVGLGAVALLASWLLGSPALAVVGIGVLLAGSWGRLWSRRAANGLVVERRAPPARVVEGGDISVGLVVRRASRLPIGSAYVRNDLGPLGRIDVPLREGRAQLDVNRVPRGRYTFGPAQVVLADPLGLERVTVVDPAEPVLYVDPRIDDLPALFTDAGARHEGGARARLRRPGGFELHAVREYQAGEPLRAVHWPSTARRGLLMVKELDDVPRDDVVVVLDQQPGSAIGERGSSSLDAAVRAAGSIARAHAGRGRRVALLLTGGGCSLVRIASLDREWATALDALAAAEADAARPLAAVLTDPQLPAARAPELVVVTAGARHAVAALEVRARGGRATALVAVDAPTFAGAPATFADPTVLRLGAAGVRVAAMRRGDAVGTALAGTSGRSAHA